MAVATSLAAASAIGGGIGAYNAAPGSPSFKKYGPIQAAFQPLLLAFLQAGGDLDALRVTKGKKSGGQGRFYMSDGTPVRKAETVRLGGKRFALTGETARGILNQQFEKAQQEAVDQTQKNFNLLFGPDGPQLLKDKISERPQQIRDAFGPAVSRTLREALGGAAPAGTLTTDAILNRVAAPVAFNAESLFQQAEDVANAQELGLSGVPGFGSGFGANPSNFTQPQSLPFLQNLGLQSYSQGYLPAAMGNYQGRAASQGFKSGIIASTGGQLAGLFGMQTPGYKAGGGGVNVPYGQSFGNPNTLANLLASRGF